MKKRFKRCLILLLMVAGAHTVYADALVIAREALRDGLYSVALINAEKALKEGGDSEVPSFLILLEVLAKQERYSEILARLNTVDSRVIQGLSAEALIFWRAYALLHNGQPTKAIELAKHEVNQVSPYGDALRQIVARAYQASGDLTAALTVYAIIDRSTTNQNVRAANALEWAIALDQNGQTEPALAVLRRQSEFKSNDAAMSEGALLRGRLLLREGRQADALTIFDKVAKDDQGSERARVQALVALSVVAFDRGKTNDAVTYARNAYKQAQQDETRRHAGFRLGDLLSASSNTLDEAESIIKALVREFPDNPASIKSQLNLADAYLHFNRPERAANEYQIFLESYPATLLNARVLQGRGWALMQLGRFAESSSVFQRAFEMSTLDIEKAECLFKQGDALLADSRFIEASQAYARLPDLYPLSIYAEQALFQSAECLVRAGKTMEACEQYRKGAKIFPDREVAYKSLLRLAAVESDTGEFDQAINTYTMILEKYKQKATRIEALLGRGNASYRMYRFDVAMQDFKIVAESDAIQRAEARFLQMLCLYGLGRDQESRDAALMFLSEFPASTRTADTVLWLGKFDFNRRKFKDAQQFFSDYVTRWPDNRWADAALLWAARAAYENSDFTGAIEYVTRLVKKYPQSVRYSEALLVQIDSLMELARFEETIFLIDQFIAQIKQTDQRQSALLRKGDCLFTMGADNSLRYQEALIVYRGILDKGQMNPALALVLHYKVGRCLEKMKRLDDAIEQFYSEVIIRFQNERLKGVFFDDVNTTLFVRAAFIVAELYEQRRQSQQAISVLQRVVETGVLGAEEARQRIERLRTKKTGVL